MIIQFIKIKTHTSVSTHYGEETTIGAGEAEHSSSGKANYKSIILNTETNLIHITDKLDRVVITTMFNLACGYPQDHKPETGLTGPRVSGIVDKSLSSVARVKPSSKKNQKN